MSATESRGVERWLAPALLALGVVLWLVSAAGLDPTNVPQAKDFASFHFPSIQAFAERPFLEALSNYRAAPFPLFYILGGWLYSATGSVVALKVATVILALGIAAGAFVIAARRHGKRAAEPLLLVAATLISPYFRGQSVYANTDILALFFAVAALVCFGERAPRFPSARAVGALVLACCAVYTRQFYVFLPAYLLLRIYFEQGLRSFLGAALECALLALPVVALVLYWGGLTTPRFAQHATVPSLGTSVPAVVLLLAFYATPLFAITVWKFRARAVAELRSLPKLVVLVPVLVLGVHSLFVGGVPKVVGGGIPLHLLRALPLPGAARSILIALLLVLGVVYLVYLVAESPAKNSILLLVFACFVPTGILYQRYFDPLMPLLWATALTTRELPAGAGAGRAALLAIIALELLVAVTGMVHYRSVFYGSSGAG